MMSKIPSFGFRSKLKAPGILKAKTANARKSDDHEAKSNTNPRQERPSNSQPEEVVSYSPHREENTLKDINNGDDNEHKNNNVIARTTASKENFEQTSNNLSKLADKLNAGTSKPASGIPSKIPPKPAFRRKGSSNIAKLTSGKGSGATQIHGQTPYMKSPRIDSKPPLGATKNGTEAHTNVKSRLVRTSAISSGIGRGFIQKEDDKEADNANETFSMPLKKQRGETDQSSVQNQGKSTSAVRRPSPVGAVRSGIRPPSGNFSGIATGLPVPRADTKMKPPAARPVASSSVSTAAGVVLRRNSGQDSSIVKRNSKENLKTSGIVTPRQKMPSKELQTMAEKLKSYSGKKMQRPVSVSSETDLRKSAIMSSQGRRSLNPTNLRTVNCKSLQDLSPKTSNQETVNAKSRHRRSSSYDKNTKNNSLNVLSVSSNTNEGTNGVNTRTISTSNQNSDLGRPKRKTFTSTNSEFGNCDHVNGEPYQSTPVSKSSPQTFVSDGKGHPFGSALSTTISGVFEETSVPSDPEEKSSRLPCRRGLNETFDGKAHNRTFDATFAKNNTFNADPVARNGTFCKEPQGNTTFEVEAPQEAFSGSSLSTDVSCNSSYGRKNVASEDTKGSDVENIVETERKMEDGKVGLSVEDIDSCKAGSKQKGDEGGLEELLDGHCSDYFLLNGSMPTLDGSFGINLTNEGKDIVSSSPMNKQHKKDPEQSPNQRKEGDVFEVVAGDSLQRPKSASRELDFEGSTNRDRKMIVKDDVLASSLINDSYDIVTVEEASESDESIGLWKTKTGVLEPKSVELKAETCDTKVESKKEDSCVDISSSKSKAEEKCSEIPPDEETAKVVDKGTCNQKNNHEETTTACKDNSIPTDAPNRFQIPLTVGRSESGLQSDKSIMEKDFSSLLSQTVESVPKCSEERTGANTEQVLLNLLTPEDSAEAVKDLISSLPTSTNQMKIALRRRSLVRRNTSPYVTGSLPGSMSTGTSFRIPRETSIAETDDGNVLMDEGTYRHCQNDVRMMKTSLLRLKRVLQEADIMSPFVKHANQFTSSPPVTPTRATVLSRSFSDASSWLVRAKKAPDVTPATEQMRQLSKQSVNKTDEDKVKDEIKDLKEYQARLERELEEARHELETKDNTIKLLQTQLENQEYLEQIELLTEEKIILFEENQELKERLEEFESKDQNKTPSVNSFKDEFLKKTKSASKIKSEIIKGYYEEK